MNRKKLLSSVVAGIILAAGLSLSSVQAASVTRIDGGNNQELGIGRIATANQVALDTFGKADNVILVNGYGYADAVSATPFAKILNAPVLLTNGDTLEPEVKSTLDKLGAKNVYIVGGTGVVKPVVENSLKTTYQKVERVAGTDDKTRMGTNEAVAKKVLESTKQKKAVLVNGYGYADALSVASIAAQKGYPVLFSSKDEIPSIIKNVITSNSLQVMAVGGTGVLSESTLGSVNAERVTKNAANRFATNLEVLNYFKNEKNGGLDFSNIYIAAGGAAIDQFADALVASAAAAKTGSPVILSGSGADTQQVEAAQDYIVSNMKETSKLTIVGGKSVVSEEIESSLKTGDTLQIVGIE